MTPKEKAKELVENYKFVYIPNYTSMYDVKVCTLIAVDELIKQQESYNNGSFYPSKYWNEVKQEIEKL